MARQSARDAFIDHLAFTRCTSLEASTAHDRFFALARTARDLLAPAWLQSQRTVEELAAKTVHYLSAEFLLGRLLVNNLINLGVLDEYRAAVQELGVDWARLVEEEPDAGLGNGGLGRLAACLLDSLASGDYPALGYGIRYEFGLFDQRIVGGAQVEAPERWLANGNPWEVVRPEHTVTVRFYGHTEWYAGDGGAQRVRWVDGQSLWGVPYDVPVTGYRSHTIGTLRLWAARTMNELDLPEFNAGDYMDAVAAKDASELLSKVLYPNDESLPGKELRLKQEYFFVACSVADIIRRYLRRQEPLDGLPDRVAMQLNDTHPAVSVAELMRVLIDEQDLEWERAWRITVGVTGYTNHTLMREALESWTVSLFGRVLPRHLEIIEEINRRFLDQVRARFPGDEGRVQRLSLFEEGREKKVRMAHLAVVGAHAINGVSAVHSKLLREELLADFAALWPERFSNKTNGVSPRRWLLACNPGLARLLTHVVGPRWPTEMERVQALAGKAGDAGLLDAWRSVRRSNRDALARLVRDRTGVAIDPASLVDVHVKRIHEYKRQALSALHALALWRKGTGKVARTVVFAGKAAPGYRMAKLLIRFVNAVAAAVNPDAERTGLRVVFLPNYDVSLAEVIIPAADVSEQISAAGTEASGTSNMKLAMNGAVTVGSWDGANLELAEAVGERGFRGFGLTVAEARALRPAYRPWDVYRREELLRDALDFVRSGALSPGDPGAFQPLFDSLLGGDPYFVLQDFPAYWQVQRRLESDHADERTWLESSLHTISRTAPFSSDRTIKEYASEIWEITPQRG
jgi:starch phosphorylase